MYNRFYPNLRADICVDVFSVMDYYSCNRHSFDGLHFTAQFGKLFEACKSFIPNEDRLARAVDIVLTLEQRRMNSYSQGNCHIEDYHPEHVKSWTEYLK